MWHSSTQFGNTHSYVCKGVCGICVCLLLKAWLIGLSACRMMYARGVHMCVSVFFCTCFTACTIASACTNTFARTACTLVCISLAMQIPKLTYIVPLFIKCASLHKSMLAHTLCINWELADEKTFWLFKRIFIFKWKAAFESSSNRLGWRNSLSLLWQIFFLFV